MGPGEADSPRRPPGAAGQLGGSDESQVAPDDGPAELPLAVFRAYLRRLHDGPPQHAAAVRVALAVWQGAVERGDAAQARESVVLVRAALDRLLASLTELQETGRRWSGVRTPSPDEAAAAERAAEAWEARRRERGEGQG